MPYLVPVIVEHVLFVYETSIKITLFLKVREKRTFIMLSFITMHIISLLALKRKKVKKNHKKQKA